MIILSRKFLHDILFAFFALFIFSSAFSIAIAQISLGLSLVLFLILVVTTRCNPFVRSLKWFYIFVALYIFWLLLSALVGPTPLRSVWIAKEEWLFCAIPIGIFLFDFPRYRNKLIAAFGSGVMLVAIYGIVQHFTGFHWFKAIPPKTAPDYGYLACGNFSHSLTFGNYFSTAAVFLIGFAFGAYDKLNKSSLAFFIFSALMGMIATVLSYSRGAILGLVMVLAVMGLILKRRYFLITFAIIAAIGITIVIAIPGITMRFTDKTEKDLGGIYEGGRVFIWKNSLKVIEEHPVFGVGQGNFRSAYTSHLRPDIPEKRKHAHAHNDLLNVAAVAGIPAMLAFLGMWIAAVSYFWKGWRMRHETGSDGIFSLAALLGSLVFFVTSIFEATFADEEVRQMLMFIWAAGLRLWYKGVKHSELPLIKKP
ncbi:MAG: O-antigen ligase family protein [Candidatus Zixiibacteriota bacterium]